MPNSRPRPSGVFDFDLGPQSAIWHINRPSMLYIIHIRPTSTICLHVCVHVSAALVEEICKCAPGTAISPI